MRNFFQNFEYAINESEWLTFLKRFFWLGIIAPIVIGIAIFALIHLAHALDIIWNWAYEATKWWE